MLPFSLAFCLTSWYLQDINKYSSFSVLPRDLSQQIFNELVASNRLTETLLETFWDCALQVRLFMLTGMTHNLVL